MGLFPPTPFSSQENFCQHWQEQMTRKMTTMMETTMRDTSVSSSESTPAQSEHTATQGDQMITMWQVWCEWKGYRVLTDTRRRWTTTSSSLLLFGMECEEKQSDHGKQWSRMRGKRWTQEERKWDTSYKTMNERKIGHDKTGGGEHYWCWDRREKEWENSRRHDGLFRERDVKNDHRCHWKTSVMEKQKLNNIVKKKKKNDEMACSR